MRSRLQAMLFVLTVSACASARSAENPQPAALVYFAGESPPKCAVEKVGTLSATIRSTETGEARLRDLKTQIGQRARARGADAVIGVSSRQLVTVTVARSESEARRNAKPPANQDVTGTLVRFVDPECAR